MDKIKRKYYGGKYFRDFSDASTLRDVLLHFISMVCMFSIDSINVSFHKQLKIRPVKDVSSYVDFESRISGVMLIKYLSTL